MGVDQPCADAGQAPHFQRQVGRSQLEGGETDVEVVVDQPGHDDVVAGTDDLGVGMLAAELPVVAHRLDLPVPLQHRAVGNHLCRMGAGDPADDVLSPD